VSFQGTFQEASDYARGLNRCCGRRGHLASVTTSAENSFVAGLLVPFIRSTPFGVAADLAYVGLNNRANQATYAWDGTNETVANSGGYVNWCTPENSVCNRDNTPRSGQTFCTSMLTTSGHWYTFDCAFPAGVQGYRYLVLEYDC
jgi:hypothetical protein